MGWFKKEENKKNEGPVEPVSMETVEKKVRGFIAGKTKLIKIDDLAPTTKLFSSGLLDSLTFIQLVSFIEREFKVQLSKHQSISMDSFDQLDQIVQAVTRCWGKGL